MGCRIESEHQLKSDWRHSYAFNINLTQEINYGRRSDFVSVLALHVLADFNPAVNSQGVRENGDFIWFPVMDNVDEWIYLGFLDCAKHL